MSTRADELRAEAEHRHQAIATDLELVGDRVSPGRMAERRKAAVLSRLTGVRTKVVGAGARRPGRGERPEVGPPTDDMWLGSPDVGRAGP